jgi:hypothetical protein
MAIYFMKTVYDDSAIKPHTRQFKIETNIDADRMLGLALNIAQIRGVKELIVRNEAGKDILRVNPQDKNTKHFS